MNKIHVDLKRMLVYPTQKERKDWENSCTSSNYNSRYRIQSGKHARSLAERLAPSLQNSRNFVDQVNKKSYEVYIAFPSFPGKQQHFPIIITKLLPCFCGESIFFKENLPMSCFRTL